MKKLCKVLTMFLVVFILSGCMKVDLAFVIKDKDHAEIKMKVLMEEEQLTEFGTSKEDFYDSIKNNQDYKDWDMEKVEEETDGKNYIGAILTSPDDSKIMKKLLNYLKVTENNGEVKYVFEDKNNEILGNTSDLDSSEISADTLKAGGVEMTASFQMPGKITEASIGKIDGNTVTIDLFDLDKDVTGLKIVSVEETSSSNLILYIAVGAVAIIAIAAFVILKYNKKNIIDSVNNTSSTTETTDTSVDETSSKEAEPDVLDRDEANEDNQEN